MIYNVLIELDGQSYEKSHTYLNSNKKVFEEGPSEFHLLLELTFTIK